MKNQVDCSSLIVLLVLQWSQSAIASNLIDGLAVTDEVVSPIQSGEPKLVSLLDRLRDDPQMRVYLEKDDDDPRRAFLTVGRQQGRKRLPEQRNRQTSSNTVWRTALQPICDRCSGTGGVCLLPAYTFAREAGRRPTACRPSASES